MSDIQSPYTVLLREQRAEIDRLRIDVGECTLVIEQQDRQIARLRAALLDMFCQFSYPSVVPEWPYADGGLSALELAADVLVCSGLIERHPTKTRMYRALDGDADDA
jgi:hypothetical protein